MISSYTLRRAVVFVWTWLTRLETIFRLKRLILALTKGRERVLDPFIIERLKRHFPAVPVKVILIDVDESNYDAAALG